MTLKPSGEVGSEHSSPPSPSIEDSSSSSKIETEPCEGDLLIVRHNLFKVSERLNQLKEKTFSVLDVSLVIWFTLQLLMEEVEQMWLAQRWWKTWLRNHSSCQAL